MDQVQDLQAQLLLVKAKAYDDREKAEKTETAYQEALGQIASALGYASNNPATVAQMVGSIQKLQQALTVAQGETEFLRNELKDALAKLESHEPAVIDEAEFEEVDTSKLGA